MSGFGRQASGFKGTEPRAWRTRVWGMQGTEPRELPGYSSGFGSSVTEQGTWLEKLRYQVSWWHVSGARNPSIQVLGCRFLEVWEAGLWPRGGPVHLVPLAKCASLRAVNPRRPCNRVAV